jgi:hypothetical protein
MAGTIMIRITNKKAITFTWFYFLTSMEGNAIPTLNEFDPSGFPNFMQFYLTFSLVKHSYALEIIINLAAA